MIHPGNLMAALALAGLVWAAPSAARAYDFGEVTGSIQSLHSGDTHHGYREFRANLENRSSTRSHRVTLVFPQHAWSAGNGIDRLTRTVVLAPGARVNVPLWQPPLPVYGDGQVRVEIDGSPEGSMPLANSGSHINRGGRSYGGGNAPSVILISRSLEFDPLNAAFGGVRSGYTASVATGSPDSFGRSGYAPTAWSPDFSSYGPQWLELDYAPLAAVDRVQLHSPVSAPSFGELILIGVSGTNLARVPFSSGVRTTSTPPVGRAVRSVSWHWDYTFPATVEPVKTVRLELGTSPSGVAIDAVGIMSGPSTVWATTARSSSDASSAPPSSSAPDPVECLRAELPVAEWSDRWLAYSAYDGIVLSASDLAAMRPGVATAIWQYVECGGNLFLVGASEPPEPWRSLARRADRDGVNSVGFGKCFFVHGEQKPQLDGTAVSSTMNAAIAAARYWVMLPSDSYSANVALPVVENLRVPVRSLVLLMLGFVLLIGPVNLIVLSRLKRRTWMLWTIPAISALTCLLVFVYSLLSEGVRPNVRRESVTLLDQVNHRATSLGAVAFYCPLTPSQGLRFSPETEATPLVPIAEYQSGTAREVDWTQTQHFRRGWVTARVPAHFMVRKSEARRERLQLEPGNGGWNAVNGLGAPVRRCGRCGWPMVPAAFTPPPTSPRERRSCCGRRRTTRR